MNMLVWMFLFLSLALTGIVIRMWNSNKKLRRQAEAEVLEKQQIISIISHDIKTPFTSIFALMHLISLDENKLSAEQKGYLDKIHQVGADGLSLMRNLVDYRNLVYRQTEIITERTNVGELLNTIIANAIPLAEKKQLQLIYDIPGSIEIETDHTCLSRAVENILANAIKFSPPAKQVSVQLKEPLEDSVAIFIKDEGPGLTAEDLSRLYGKFQKLSARPTAGESSTGLGLFVAKAMISKIKGRLQCVTKEGNGTTFIISIPTNIQREEWS